MELRNTCPICKGNNLVHGDAYEYEGATYYPYKCKDCKTYGADKEITPVLFTYNVGFLNSSGQEDETQLNASSIKELGELIESLKNEMDIQKITYIEITTEEG